MKCFSLLALVTLIASAACAESESSEQTNVILFDFAFGAIVHPDSAGEFRTIRRDTTLRTGDRFKLYVLPRSSCHLYLIYVGSSGEVMTLYPPPSAANTQTQPDEFDYVPAGTPWFTLDEQVGDETFYLLASIEPLNDWRRSCWHNPATTKKNWVRQSGSARKCAVCEKCTASYPCRRKDRSTSPAMCGRRRTI